MPFESLFIESIAPALLPFLIPIIIWEAVWKAIGAWKSARQDQLVWFIFIFITNTLGILPIVYLLFFQKDKSKKKKSHRR